MKLAVALINNAPAFHFGKANDFKILTIEEGKIFSTEDIYDDNHTHQARPAFLKDLGVEALICNGIGSGAVDRLVDAGIVLYGFNELSVPDAIHAFVKGTLPAQTDFFECKC
jgi:predicted Fe-Mo cluster-binding NifX family protein